MPNHCTNNLMVMGDEKEVKRFREAITNGENLEQYSEFSILANLLPTPEELNNTPIRQRGAKGSFSSDEQKKWKNITNQISQSLDIRIGMTGIVQTTVLSGQILRGNSEQSHQQN